LTPDQIERYLNIGQKLEFMNDTIASSYFDWEHFSSIKYKNTTDTYQVTSGQNLDERHIDGYMGHIHCRLMSPARILEWILVDGL